MKGFKNTVFTWLLLSVSAKAAPYVSYPDFVMMDKESKYQVVHMVQDYAVENEYQSRLYIKRLNKKSKRTSFFDLFMDDAHAALNGHGKPCMYAGWVSVLQQSGNSAYCNNPRKYKASIGRYSASDESFKEDLKYAQTLYNQYQGEVKAGNFAKISYSMEGDQLKLNIDKEPSKGACNIDGGAVLCNPLVFGKVKGKVMCVPGDADYRGYNSSFLCERAVNKLKNESEEEYKELMDGIIAEVLANQDKTSLFLATLKDMYDMCMCSQDEGKHENMRINKDYADRMFYSRTCAGVIYQSQTVLEKLSHNEEASCKILVENDNTAEDWLKFARQAYYNVQIETENLGRDWVTKLEVIDREKGETQPEEEAIKAKREAARQARGGQFCPIDIEIPDDDEVVPDDDDEVDPVDPVEPGKCAISVAKNEEDNSYEVLFKQGKNEEGKLIELENYVFTPELTFKKDEDGSLIAKYQSPDAPEEKKEASDEKDDEKKEDQEQKSARLPNGQTSDQEKEKEDKVEENKEEDKKEKESIKFTVELKGADGIACSAQDGDGDDTDDVVDDNEDEDPDDNTDDPAETKCSLALKLEPNGEAYNVIAIAKDGDKEISPGQDGYSVTFINTSVEGEPQDAPEPEEEAMVQEETDDKKDDKEKEDKKEVITGSELESIEGDSFSASLPASDKEQKIVALLRGPKSCEAKAEVSASSLIKAPTGSPKFRQTPKAQRASPMRHMKALRGNY